MIPKKNRIDTETLKKVLKTGKNKHSEHFFVKSLNNLLDISRFAIVISKKTSKSSVRRHLIKRRVSDVLEKKNFLSSKIADHAIFSKDNITNLEYKTIKSEIENLLF